MEYTLTPEKELFMKRTSLILLFAAFLMIFSIPLMAMAENFYVETDGSDANDGSSSDPWKTIQGAIDNAAVDRGDTLYIGAGTYTETVDVTKAVRIYGDQGVNPEMLAAATGDKIFNILSDDVEILYLIINGQDAAEITGIYVGNGADNFSTSYCEIKNNNHGIYLAAADDSDVTNNEFSNNNKAIYLSSADAPRIKYNDFEDNKIGVYLLESEIDDVASNAFEGGDYGIYLESEDGYYNSTDVSQLNDDNSFNEIDINNVGLGDGDEDENNGILCFIGTICLSF
jgi:parallel beta-helix repeat protein